jgi:hypothetical protein
VNEQLQNEFQADMQWIIDEEARLRKTDKRFRSWSISTRFIQMLHEFGATGMAHRLLKTHDLPPMFAYLRSINMTQLCMEHYVAKVSKYRNSGEFSPEEIEIAEWRLTNGL